MCPECGSDDIRIEPYDFGRCSETGYHDAGERYQCLGCGASGDAGDLLAAADESGNQEPPALMLRQVLPGARRRRVEM